MKVYVLEEGAYDEREITGVYTTLASAKAAATHNPARWEKNIVDQSFPQWWNRTPEARLIAWVSEHALEDA